MEKIAHAAGSGMDLSHGQLLKVHVEGFAHDRASYAQKVYATCRYDCILELTSTGASVYS